MPPICPARSVHAQSARLLLASSITTLFVGLMAPVDPAQAQTSLGSLFSGPPATWSNAPQQSAHVGRHMSYQPGAYRKPSVAARFEQQLAADREYLQQYHGGTVVQASHAEAAGSDPAYQEPVVNYDEYVADPANGGEVPFVVADEMSIVPSEGMSAGCGGTCGTCGNCGSCWQGTGYGYPNTQCWQPRLWVEGGYLLWWVQGFSTPPLVTSSPSSTAQNVAGVLGQPTTTILYGGDRLAGDARSGFRLMAGTWIDPYNIWGIEASYMYLGTESDSFSAASAGGAGDAYLARPFFNVEAGVEGEDASLLAIPGELAGRVHVGAKSKFDGLEVLGRRAMGRGQWHTYDLLFGWRYNRLDDDLVIDDYRESIDDASGLDVGTTIQSSDTFRTRNKFNGAEIGVVAKRRWSRWTTEFSMKLALGNTSSKATIDGMTVTTVPLAGGGTDVDVINAGLLAQQTNIGTYKRDQFSMIPELGVTLGYNLTSRLQATFGYSFIYWSRVARAGDQIDTDLNLTQLDPGGLVGNPRPRFAWDFDDVWAQGMTLGLDFTF